MHVKLLGEVGRLAEFAVDAEGLAAVRDAGFGERVRNLRAHAADDLMIFDGDKASAGFHGG